MHLIHGLARLKPCSSLSLFATAGNQLIGNLPIRSQEYPDLKVSFVVDGSRMGSDLLRGMHSGETRDSVRAGRIMSADKIQEMLFAKPVSRSSAFMWIGTSVFTELITAYSLRF
jgi:hypothetical protein